MSTAVWSFSLTHQNRVYKIILQMLKTCFSKQIGRCYLLHPHILIYTHATNRFVPLSKVSFISVLILLQVTETRTGPLGCSSYDNLDSVSSILLQSPESKLHLQGKQTLQIPYAVPRCWASQGSWVKLHFGL